MKNLLSFVLFVSMLSYPGLSLVAQTPFTTYDSININNINARQLVHGDMWWDPVAQTAGCEFPKGSGKTLAAGAGLWLSGYDPNNKLHIAAQTYRQIGNDYWPGPLDPNDTLSYSTSQKWARIWKVNASDIASFRATTTHTVSNTPAVILEWPAKGNTHARGFNNASLTITGDMAPFVDVNSDGIYDALQGDYPAIKGDQALWYVFSDNGPTHTETNGLPLKVEVHAMAFAYNRGTLIDNVVYYEFDIHNKSSVDYNNFRAAEWADMDLGWAFDDYVGFDSTWRLGIIYNGKGMDGSGQSTGYGAGPPMAGITLVVLPGDNAPSSYVPAGSFMYSNNDATSVGNPITAIQHNDYMRSMWMDSTQLVNDFQGFGTPTSGHGIGNSTRYVYPGDPGDHSAWSECSSQNAPNDRRFIITSNDFTLNAGASQKVVMALVVTNPGAGSCPNTTFDSIRIVADTAWKIYLNPLPASVNNIAIASNKLSIYPNPAHDKVCFETGNSSADETVTVYNSLGQSVNLNTNKLNSKTEINIGLLPAGIYYILYRNKDVQKTGTFNKY